MYLLSHQLKLIFPLEEYFKETLSCSFSQLIRQREANEREREMHGECIWEIMPLKAGFHCGILAAVRFKRCDDDVIIIADRVGIPKLCVGR